MAAGILSGMEGKQGIRAWRWSVRHSSNPLLIKYYGRLFYIEVRTESVPPHLKSATYVPPG